MSAYDLVLRGPAVVTPEGTRPAAVAVTAGTITAVAPLDTPFDAARTVYVPPGRVLMPGIVDTHVHVNEPGRTEWEGFATATAAAAAGGVTTIVDMPLNSVPATLDVPALEVKRRAAAPAVRVDVGFWGGAVPGNLGRLAELHEAGVLGFKCFLSPSGVPEFEHLTTAQLWRAQAELADLDALLLVHAEDPAHLRAHRGGRDYAGFLASRPPAAEVAAIERVVEGLRRHGGRAHILHLSAADALPTIRAAKDEGLGLTVETCPHYLTLTAEAVPDGATTHKCCPPIRDAANRDRLWEALADGSVDTVVTDHSPATEELKLAGGGDFAQAWGGIAGLEVGFRAVWAEAFRRGFPLEQVVGWMATATADLGGLHTKGRIAVGADADLVVLDPAETTTVVAADLHHRNKVSAYEGVSVLGDVRQVYLRGTRIDADTPRPADPAGRLLTRPLTTEVPA